MAFKNLCCNICAWFSVIGIATFGVLAAMLYRRNGPVIKHKFLLKGDNEKQLDDLTMSMIYMQIVMLFAALCCFSMAFRYGK